MSKELTLKNGMRVKVVQGSEEMDACTGCGLPVPVPKQAPNIDPTMLPKEGQPSACMVCGTVNIFGFDLRLREATDEELDQIVDEHGVNSCTGAAAYVQRERRRTC